LREASPVIARKQRGVLIVALMAGIAIAMILTTVAVQAWSDVLRRDNEAEMMFRAQDIVRALKRFQREKGKLPTELKELMEPGNKGQYFLRRLWKDPLVKGGQWQYLYASPAGGLFDPSAAGLPDAPGGLPGAVAPPGLPPPAQGLPQTGQEPIASPGTQPGAFAPFPAIGKQGDASGDTTGLPIAGVKTRCKDHTFRRYKDKTNYSDWTFSIFDLDPHAPPNTPAINQKNPQGAQFPPTGTGTMVPDPNKH
jgi:type II secretory pathway pseudopilin PulG